MEVAPKRSSTRIREGFFDEFAEKVRTLKSPIPIQLSGGKLPHFRAEVSSLTQSRLSITPRHGRRHRLVRM